MSAMASLAASSMSTTSAVAPHTQPLQQQQQSTDQRGVLALLKLLRTCVHHEKRSSLRQILPVYEQLLAHRQPIADSPSHIASELSRIRLMLREHADMFSMVERLDDVAERCLKIAFDTPALPGAEAPFPMEAALRLLVALSGGRDGHTFRLEDPTRVSHETAAATVPRVAHERMGERIHMKNVRLVVDSHVMFGAESIPLHEQAVLAKTQFGLFQNLSADHSSLWVPEPPSTADSQSSAFHGSLGSTRFLGLADESTGAAPAAPLPDIFAALPTAWGLSSPPSRAKASARATTTQRDEPEAEVFFFDGSKDVQCRYDQGAKGWSWRDNDSDSSSQTASSSEDSFVLDRIDSCHSRQSLSAWEDIGDVSTLAASLRPVNSADVAATSCLRVDPRVAIDPNAVQVDELDVVEDALRVLSGVESVVFRRDVSAACFRLPEKRAVTLPLGTAKSLASTLETFRAAGSLFLRLEFLATYYAQDATRGGKTLQAMGDALLLYLAAHQSTVDSIAQDIARSGASLASVVAATRHVCRQLRFVATLFCCLESEPFWPLLVHKAFPRGIALLDRLYDAVATTTLSDAVGKDVQLATWFLVRASAPFLAVLTEFVSTGDVSDAADPHDEFALTTWSLFLTEVSATDSGDGLLTRSFGTQSIESMLPAFLRPVADKVIRLGVVQRMLQRSGVDTHPSVSIASEPLRLDRSVDDAMAMLERLDATIRSASVTSRHALPGEDVAEDADALVRRVDNAVETPCASVSDPTLSSREHKVAAQTLQRALLDEQTQATSRLVETERALDAARDAELEQQAADAQAKRESDARDFVLDKYVTLLRETEERHQYALWRRNRALRCSSARAELRQLLETDKAQWLEAQRVRASGGDGTSSSDDALLDDEDVRRAAPADCSMDIEPHDGASTAHQHPPGRAGDGWKYSVRVNVAAGSRDSVVLSHAGAAEHDARDVGRAKRSVANIRDANARSEQQRDAATVRVLREPGDSGSSMYACLYGDRDDVATATGARKSSERIDPDSSDSLADGDEQSVVWEELARAEDGDEATGDDGDVEMRDVSSERGDCASGAHGTLDARSLASLSTRDASGSADVCESPLLLLDSLPDVHAFFAHDGSGDDVRVLKQALAPRRRGAHDPFESLESFRLVVQRCIEAPVKMLSRALDRVSVELFLRDLDVLAHARWLHNVMLMSEGLCMDIFARDLLAGVRSATRLSWGMSERLTSALTLAMIESRVYCDAYAPRFAYATSDDVVDALGSATLAPDIPRLLAGMELRYALEWPLGAVLSTSARRQYAAIHRTLLYYRLTSLELHDTWLTTRKAARTAPDARALLATCDSVFFTTQSLLSALSEAFVTKVLLAAWDGFERRAASANTVLELRCAHEQFVTTAASCCFVDGASGKIREALARALAAAWKLASLVRTLEARLSSIAHDAAWVQDLVRDHSAALRALVRRLQRVSSDRDRCVREFCEHLVVRLNFNGFYAEAPEDSEQQQQAL